jgi:hypothetical protein
LLLKTFTSELLVSPTIIKLPSVVDVIALASSISVPPKDFSQRSVPDEEI